MAICQIFDNPELDAEQRRRSRRDEGRGTAMTRLLTLVGAVAAMLALAGPASAQAGCQAFGKGLASEAQRIGGLGQDVRGVAPVNDEVAFFKGVFCP